MLADRGTGVQSSAKPQSPDRFRGLPSLPSNGTGGWSGRDVASIWYRKSGMHGATDLLSYNLNSLIKNRDSSSAYIHIFTRGCKNGQLRKFRLEQSFIGDSKQWRKVHCAPSQCLLVCPYQLAVQRCNNLDTNSSTTNGIMLQLHHCAWVCYFARKRWQCWGRHLTNDINMHEDISCWKCDK